MAAVSVHVATCEILTKASASFPTTLAIYPPSRAFSTPRALREANAFGEWGADCADWPCWC
jgi:hypothetical protein